MSATIGESVRPTCLADDLYRDFPPIPSSVCGGKDPRENGRGGGKLGFTVTEKVGKTGVVAGFATARADLMIRADMDACDRRTDRPSLRLQGRAVARSGVETE